MSKKIGVPRSGCLFAKTNSSVAIEEKRVEFPYSMADDANVRVAMFPYPRADDAHGHVAIDFQKQRILQDNHDSLFHFSRQFSSPLRNGKWGKKKERKGKKEKESVDN